MKTKPIIFNGPMIRALLEGRKAQNRQVLDSPCDDAPAFARHGVITSFDEDENPYRWPRTHAVGDLLWVREPWRSLDGLDHLLPSGMGKAALEAGYQNPWAPIQYEADCARANWIADPHSFGDKPGRYRHARFMPRWASRLTLEVTDVRVQRVQDISEEDARAEGILPADAGGVLCWRGFEGAPITPSAVVAFADLWDSINGPGAWARNDWIAALTFRVHHTNIDSFTQAQAVRA